MMPAELLSIIIYILIGLIIIVLALLIRTELRLKLLLKGKDAKTLEDSFKNLEREMKEFEVFKNQTDKRLTSAEGQLQKSIQGVGVVRFNPFKGTSGSNQSFAVALVDTKGDGVVFSSLYSREHVSIFSKPVINQASEYDLSNEEKEAIKQAMDS